MNRVSRTLMCLTGLTCGLSFTLAAPCAAPQYQLENMTFQTATRYQIPEALFVAMIATESTFCPTAVSSKGALGLGQLMPDTARSLNLKNPLNPQENLNASAVYLRSMFNQFKTWELALAAYNAGPGNVRKHNNAIPPFAETRNHVKTILKRAEALARNVPLKIMMNTDVALLLSIPGRPQANVTLLASAQAPASKAINVPLGPTALPVIQPGQVNTSSLLDAAAGAGVSAPAATSPAPQITPTNPPPAAPAAAAQTLNVSVPLAAVQPRTTVSMTVVKRQNQTSPADAQQQTLAAAEVTSLQSQAPTLQTRADLGQIQVIRRTTTTPQDTAAVAGPVASPVATAATSEPGGLTVIRPRH